MPSRLKRYRLVYAASPYRGYKGGDLEAAHMDVSEVAGRLIERGVNVFSPIAHSHEIAKHSGIDPVDHSIWMPIDAAMASACDALVVICLDGWMASKGIEEEIEIFEQRGKTVYYLDPVTMEIAG